MGVEGGSRVLTPRLHVRINYDRLITSSKKKNHKYKCTIVFNKLGFKPSRILSFNPLKVLFDFFHERKFKFKFPFLHILVIQKEKKKEKKNQPLSLKVS